MLARDLELAGLDERQWVTWWHLLAPPAIWSERFALVIVSNRTPIKCVIAGHGAVAPGPLELTHSGLTAFAARHQVGAVIALDDAVISELAREIESALRSDQDYVEQGLIALRALKQRSGKGVWTTPPLLDLVPAPSYDSVQRTFDVLIPDRSALACYVIDDRRERIAASVIATKQSGDIARVASHLAIADIVAESTFARSWDRQYKRVLDAIEQRFAAPSLAIFLERATLERIITGPSDQLARELNAKRVVVDPAPAWLLGLLGSATMAAMAGRAATALASMLPTATRDRAAALAQRARDALNPFGMLGFDPIELWTQLRRFYRKRSSPHDEQRGA